MRDIFVFCQTFCVMQKCLNGQKRQVKQASKDRTDTEAMVQFDELNSSRVSKVSTVVQFQKLGGKLIALPPNQVITPLRCLVHIV